MSETRIVVFAKAPVPGLAKTRLAAAIGEKPAAQLAERMLRHALEAAAQAALGPVELCCAPDAAHPALVAAAREIGADLSAQGEGDLGARMGRAFHRTLAEHDRVLMIGTDCPLLNAAALREAAAALSPPHSAVFRPALDGGYVLIGLRRYAPALFEGIAWSTHTVMQATRERLRVLRWRWWEGAPLPDIDEASDLVHLPACLS